MMETELDKILNRIKKAKEFKEQNDLLLNFEDYLLGIKPEERDAGTNFSRLPKDGRRGELWFRNKLLWLKTIPLEKEVAFVSLHSETGGYYQGKAGKFSADLLGVWRNVRTTQFAVAELKAAKSGDPIFYAVAEGLRNVYLHWLNVKRLSFDWGEWMRRCVKNGTMRKSVWMNGNPFNRIDSKNIRLLIIGDDSWIRNQRSCIKAVPALIKLGKINVYISVYSLNDGGKHSSKPYALLPLKKIL